VAPSPPGALVPTALSSHSIWTENPTFTLELGKRYRIENNGGRSAHPFPVENGNEEYLLRQEGDKDGSLEGNADINHVEDDNGVTFTPRPLPTRWQPTSARSTPLWKDRWKPAAMTEEADTNWHATQHPVPVFVGSPTWSSGEGWWDVSPRRSGSSEKWLYCAERENKLCFFRKKRSSSPSTNSPGEFPATVSASEMAASSVYTGGSRSLVVIDGGLLSSLAVGVPITTCSRLPSRRFSCKSNLYGDKSPRPPLR
jgi:hypothetical protein